MILQNKWCEPVTDPRNTAALPALTHSVQTNAVVFRQKLRPVIRSDANVRVASGKRVERSGGG